ncbi:protein arginine kinase activator [Bacillus ectoiniformans]|nr:protein arginine kinase activator [Bacillus ectoiniformans]
MKTINGEKTEIKLCEKCAHEKGEQHFFNQHSGFSISNLLGGLLNIDPVFSSKQPQYPQQPPLQCENCHMTFQQFVNRGKFGCSDCYETFNEQLKPILKRLHSGNYIHQGKIPARIGGTLHLKKEINHLKSELQTLILEENFEDAAGVRDQIRFLENKLLSEGGES